MTSDWLAPVLLLLLVMVLVLLWFELRRRRRSGLVADDGEVGDAGEMRVEAADDDPPDLQSVRASLAEARAAERAATAGEASPKRRIFEGVGAAGPVVRPDPAEEDRREQIGAEAADDGGGAGADVTADKMEGEGAVVAPEAGRAGEEETDAAARAPGDDAADTSAEEDEAKGAGSEIGEEPDGKAAEATPGEADPSSSDPGGHAAQGETGDVTEAHGPDDPGEAAACDAEGRLPLIIEMGDAVAPAELPRAMELNVVKQWPIPVIHGFRPSEERLVLRYDGPESRDVVFLPTVEATWQVNLGGRPVVQLGCESGPEALSEAIAINP